MALGRPSPDEVQLSPLPLSLSLRLHADPVACWATSILPRHASLLNALVGVLDAPQTARGGCDVRHNEAQRGHYNEAPERP